MTKTEKLYRIILRKIANSFFKGLLLIAPITITIYIIYALFEFFDGLIPLDMPGLGVLIIFGFITLMGFVGSLIIRTPFYYLGQRILNQLPIIKIVYSSIKDLLSAFVGQKKKFTEPVMVILSKESNIRKLGFVTEKDLHNIGISDDFVAVYLPHSYNFSGNMFIVPVENIVPVEANSAEFMKFIVSGGVTKV